MRISKLQIGYLKELSSSTNLHICKFAYWFGGQEWIRTTEVEDSGFTVRPIWPLWNLPLNFNFYRLAIFGLNPKPAIVQTAIA